jgi:hypothetical protein
VVCDGDFQESHAVGTAAHRTGFEIRNRKRETVSDAFPPVAGTHHRLHFCTLPISRVAFRPLLPLLSVSLLKEPSPADELSVSIAARPSTTAHRAPAVHWSFVSK